MNHRAMIKPKLLFAIALSAVLPAALTACGPAAAPPAEIIGTAIDGAAIGGPFELVDKDGKPIDRPAAQTPPPSDVQPPVSRKVP